MATKARPHQAGWSLAKDFHCLMKNIDSFSGGQARLASWDESDLRKGITVAVIPDSGLYKDGEFMFLISFKDGYPYPEYAPLVGSKTPIYHPNISLRRGREVCLNMFDDDNWTPSMTLEDVVQGILFLLHNPNLEDPMNSVFQSMDEEEFAKNVKLSLDGGYVGELRFERNRVTRGEDGEIAKDDNSPEEGGAACREEQMSKTAGGEENAKPAGAAAEIKTTDEPKKAQSGEKGPGETGVIGVGWGI